MPSPSQSGSLPAALEPLLRKQLKFFPLLGVLQAYNRDKLRHDAWAGLQVALLAFPQGLTLAMIAGLPPEHGVYAAVAGLALGAMFAGGRTVSFGPTVLVAVLLMSTFVQLQITPERRTEVVAILSVLSGLVLVVGAWFRVARLTRFISRSVTTGFIFSAGLVILASQLKHVLGLTLPDSGVFLQDVIATARAVTATRWPPLLVGSLTAGIYLACSLRARKLPAAALAVAAGSAAAWMLDRGGYPVAHLHSIEGALFLTPADGLALGWTGIIANAALATALLAHLETSLIGQSFAARSGDRFEGNQHMYGLGLAHLGNAFVGGMPCSISLSRSRLAWRAGARTAVSGLFASAFCAALGLGLGPVVQSVPRAALAALAMVLASEIVSRHYLRVIMRTSAADALVLVGTITAGLLFRLDVALYCGAGLSIVFFLRRVGVPQLDEYAFTDEGRLAAVGKQLERPVPDISIEHVEGDLFFGSSEIFLDQARRIFEDPNLKIIILRMRNAHHLDASCALAIEEFIQFARDQGRDVIISGAHREIYRVFRRSGLLEQLGRDNFFMDTPSNPTRSTRNALKRAQEILGGAKANIRIYVDPEKNRPPGEDGA